MSPIERSLLRLLMLDKGIVPMDGTPFDANRTLAELPADEARAMKRKFRKLWRKAMKAQKEGNPFRWPGPLVSNGSTPSRQQRQHRKLVVTNSLLNDVPSLIEGRLNDEQVKKPI
jgi:hypothetical protein